MKRIRQLRNESKLTQDEFGKLFNITGSAVSAYELDKREPDFELLKSIAAYFNTSVEYLLNLTDIRQKINNNDFNELGEYTSSKFNTLQNYINDILYHKCDVEGYVKLKNDISSLLDEIYFKK